MQSRAYTLAIVFFMFSSSVVLADPVTIGSQIAFALFQAGVTATFTYASIVLIGTVAIGAASIGLSSLLAPSGVGGSFDPGEFKQNFDNPEGAEIRAVGRVRLGGLFNFRNTIGFDTYRSVLQCRGPIDQIENYFIGGREVVVDTNNGGAVKSPPWSRSNTDYLTIQSKIGDGTETAWPELISNFPTLWTVEHRARGIAQLLVKYISPGVTSNLYLRLYGSAGVREQIETVVRAELVYDPRDGSTAWSENGILNAIHMLRSFPSISDENIDWDDVELEADKADTQLATRNGTEPRARAWGAWGSEGRSRNEVMQIMLNSIGAEIVTTENDKFSIRLLDDNPASEITFTDKHVLSTRLKFGPESVERPNICRVRYYSPERNYELSELPLIEDDGITPLAWSRVQSEIDAVGEQPFDLDLSFCPSAAQAQRIARRAFLTARSETGIAIFNMAGLAAWGRRVAELPFPDLDPESQKCLLGTPRVDDQQGTAEIPFVVAPTLADWNPAIDEALPLPVIPEIQFESEIDTPAMPSEAALVSYPSGGWELRVFFSGVANVLASEANYRLYTDGLPLSWNAMTEVGLDLAYLAVDDLSGRQMDFRVRMINSEDEVSYFSDLLEVPAINAGNTVPLSPVVTSTGTADGSEFTLTATIPRSIGVVTLEIEEPGVMVPEVIEVRPGDTHDIVVGVLSVGTHEWRWRVKTTDGTASSDHVEQIIINPET